MELYAFFVWPAVVFGALALYAWYATKHAGGDRPHPGE